MIRVGEGKGRRKGNKGGGKEKGWERGGGGKIREFKGRVIQKGKRKKEGKGNNRDVA